jgi:hypothetical protein
LGDDYSVFTFLHFLVKEPSQREKVRRALYGFQHVGRINATNMRRISICSSR